MKTIDNFSKYKVDENGNVYSYQGLQPRLMKQQGDRYKRVVMSNDRKVKKTISTHRLVAIAYIANPENKETVNHIDGNKHNNHASNLEWATQEENQLHADLTGLNKVKGVDNGTFKPWFYSLNGDTIKIDNETIKDFCDRVEQSSNYSNVKKWCRKNHTLNRGFFKGYTFGYQTK